MRNSLQYWQDILGYMFSCYASSFSHHLASAGLLRCTRLFILAVYVIYELGCVMRCSDRCSHCAERGTLLSGEPTAAPQGSMTARKPEGERAVPRRDHQMPTADASLCSGPALPALGLGCARAAVQRQGQGLLCHLFLTLPDRRNSPKCHVHTMTARARRRLAQSCRWCNRNYPAR